MYRVVLILILLAMFSLASVPALAVDWVWDSTVPGSLVADPGPSYTSGAFSSTVSMPTWAVYSGLAIPDLRVTYHLGIDGYNFGDRALGIWLDDSPVVSSGLFSGTHTIAWNSAYANVLDTATFVSTSDPWIYNIFGWDVDLQVVTTGGVTTATAALTNTTPGQGNEFHTATRTFNPTAGDIAAWAGKSKLAAWADGLYAQTTVSNIKFYKAADVPEPGSLMMLGMGAVGLAGLLKRRCR
jgi:hypothetical protein